MRNDLASLVLSLVAPAEVMAQTKVELPSASLAHQCIFLRILSILSIVLRLLTLLGLLSPLRL